MRRKVLVGMLFVCTAILFLSGTVGIVQAEDWPMLHHDAMHTGYSSSTSPDTNQVLWSYKTGDCVASSPAVVDGKVFFGSWDGKIYCLDENTGNLIWSYKHQDIVSSSPAVADGKVFFGSRDENIYCLDEDTGNLIWSYKTRGGVVSSPAVVDGKIFVGSRDKNIYCLDEDTGKLIWSYETGVIDHSSPAVADGKVFVGADNFYCLDKDTGKLIWKYGIVVNSAPAVADRKVFVGSWDHKIYCLDEDTGKLIWSYETGGDVFSPAVANGKIFVGSLDYKIYCLDEDTGKLIWSYETGYVVGSTPAVADGKVFVSSSDSKIYCLDEDTGKLIWSYETGGSVSSPAIADGKVFVGSRDSKIYCFGSKTPIPTTPTPTEEPLVTQLTTDSYDDITPAWSPNGEKIAFSSNRLERKEGYVYDRDYDIFVMDADGSNQKDLTYTGYDRFSNPSWSPDGSKITFWAFSPWGQGGSIWVMNADGSNRNKVYVTSGYDSYQPVWSPDESKIAFKSAKRYGGGPLELYTMNSDGTNVVKILNALGDKNDGMGKSGGSISYSPDGEWIAFESERSGNWDIWIVKPDGSNLKQLTTNPNKDFYPAWSPDGKQIAFTSDRNGNNDIWVLTNVHEVINGKTPDYIQLTTDSSDDKQPSWSPDGTKIAFSSDRKGNYDIWVASLTSVPIPTPTTPTPTPAVAPLRTSEMAKIAEDRAKTYEKLIEMYDADYIYKKKVIESAGELISTVVNPFGTIASSFAQLSKVVSSLSPWLEIFKTSAEGFKFLGTLIEESEHKNVKLAHQEIAGGCTSTLDCLSLGRYILTPGIDRGSYYGDEIDIEDYPEEFLSWLIEKKSYHVPPTVSGSSGGADVSLIGHYGLPAEWGGHNRKKGAASGLSVELAYMEYLCREEAEAWENGEIGEAKSCLSKEQRFLSNHLNWIDDFNDKIEWYFNDIMEIDAEKIEAGQEGHLIASDQSFYYGGWKYYLELSGEIAEFVENDLDYVKNARECKFQVESEEKGIPGFEVVFAIIVLLLMAYSLRRK